MPEGILPTIIVLLILGCVVALAIRSIWKNHKSGSSCSCGSGSCGGGCSKCATSKKD